MADQYDVIVVGAGNGGLAAAATTAKAGLSTLLLEKHNIPGGCASSFRRGRFEFEPSLHELCGVGSKEKPYEIYNLFKKVGADVDWKYEHNLFRVICTGEDGYDVKLKGSIDGLCESVEQIEAGSGQKVRAFLGYKSKIDAAINYIYKKRGNPNKLVMITKHKDFMRIASHSAEDVMTALGISKKIQNIINTYWCYLGVPTDELSAMHFLNLLYGYTEFGAAMPHHRSHELSLAMVDSITKNGGKIQYNSKVTEFLYNDEGRAIGVVANGQKLYAKEIISNVIPNNVYNMSTSAVVSEHSKKLINARSLGLSFVTIYLGLNITAEELGIKDYTNFIVSDPNPRKQYEEMENGSLYIVNCLNNVFEDASPAGTCSLFITLPVRADKIPDDLTPDKYKKYKNDIAKDYISRIEKVMNVSIFEHIEEISIATPVSFARYLDTPGGTAYGYVLNSWDNLMVRISAEKDDFNIPGLSFCGGHHVRGDGFSSAYITGANAANKAISRIKGGN